MHGPRLPRNPIDEQRLAKIAFAALIAGNIALALGPLFVRLATSEGGIGPVAAGFWRLALAAPILLILCRVQRQPIGRIGAGLAWTLVLGGLFFAADLGSWHVGILRTKLANATLFGNSTSLIFPLYGFMIARRWPSRTQVFALLLAAAGAVLLMGRSYELSPRYLAGDLFCMVAGLLYTFYLVAVARARDTLKPWPVLALSTLAGILPLLIFSLAMGETVWPRDFLPLIGLALMSQVIGQGLLVFAMGHVRPLIVGLALLSQPIVAAATGWIGYGERLVPADLIGAAAICAAIILVRRGEKE